MGMVDYCMTLHSFSWHLFDSTILFRISYLAPILIRNGDILVPANPGPPG